MNMKVDYNAKIKNTIEIPINIEISTNDIFNWLSDCDNVDTLRYLGRHALNQIKIIENPDNDDFRSRA